MVKTNITLLLTVMLTFSALSETTTDGQVSVPRIYLKYQYDAVSYDAHAGFRLISHPYYSFDPDYIDQKVKHFGRNIAKEMEPVPKAKQIMNGYTIHEIGVLTCAVAGPAIMLMSFVNGIKKDTKKPDGTYDVKVPAGIPVGLSVLGLGIVLNITKPIYLRAAVNEYNKHARN